VGNVDEGGRNVVKSAFECLAAAIDMVMCSVDRLLHFALVRFPALTFFFSLSFSS